MSDVCTTGDTAHIDKIFKFLPHTHQQGCIDILHCYNDPCLQVSEVTWQWWDEYPVCDFARNTRCTVTTDLLVWYTNTKENDIYSGAAILSLLKLASPSGQNVNYDEKQLTGKKKFLSCSFYLYRFRKYVSYGFRIINFCNPGPNYEIPRIIKTSHVDMYRVLLTHHHRVQ
jgi:hypothetical protein